MSMAENGQDFADWLQNRDIYSFVGYRAQRTVLKLAVKVAKMWAIRNDFERNIKIFSNTVRLAEDGYSKGCEWLIICGSLRIRRDISNK